MEYKHKYKGLGLVIVNEVWVVYENRAKIWVSKSS